MLGLSELLHYGSPFWVRYNLAQASSYLVLPSDATLVRSNTATEGLIINNFRLVVLGFCYRVRHAAAGDGFELVFGNNAEDSPSGTARIIHSCLGGAANERSELSINCFIAGDDASNTPSDDQPDSLLVRRVGTPTSGSLTVWGMQVDGDLRLHKSYTGSPVDLGA